MAKSEKTRIDRNVIDNLIDLRKFGEDSALIKAIVFYFAWKQQNSLFDNNTLDVDEFCKVLSLRREHMVIKHTAPRHVAELESTRTLKGRLEEQERNPENMGLRIFDSVIENALYRLYTENMVFSGQTRRYDSSNGDKNVVYPLDRIVFLSKLEAQHITTKSGRKKIVYNYALNQDFVKNLSLYFANVNLNHFIELRRANAEDLYIYLKNLQETLAAKGLNSTADVSFEHLCDLADIRIADNRDRKRKLIRKFALLPQKVGMQVELTFAVTPGSRWAYQPVITFPVNKGEEKAIIAENINQRQDILYHNFLQELTRIIKESMPEFRPEDDAQLHAMVVRLCQSEKMFEEKTEAFRHAQRLTFIEPRPDIMRNATMIPIKLKNVQTIDDIRKIIIGKL